MVLCGPNTCEDVIDELVSDHSLTLTQTLLCFHPAVLRVSTNTGQWKEAASKVTHALVNVR